MVELIKGPNKGLDRVLISHRYTQLRALIYSVKSLDKGSQIVGVTNGIIL